VKLILLTVLFSSFIVTVFSQVRDSIPAVDIVEITIKKLHIDLSEKTRDDRKVHFSLFPTQSGASGGGRTIVTSFNAAFYLGDKSDTRVSTVYFVPYITFVGKYGFLIRPSLWLSKNSLNLSGDYRILNYPQSTWGIEGESTEGQETEIDNSYFRFYQTAVRPFHGTNWMAGLGYMLDYHYNIGEKIPAGAEGHLEHYPDGLERTATSSGMVFPFGYDSRQSTINPAGGAFLLANYRFNAPALGSDHEWQSLYIDGRKYIPFSKYRQNLLALRAYYWTILSGQVPYLDLPSIGSDLALISSGRGIAEGRYRSNALLYFETEYRFDITANGLFGGVLFSNVMSASEYGTQDFQSWHPAIGTGLRVKFNKYSRTNIAFDIATSKNYWSFHVFIGEAF
jgi:outer membrane protein assembly factor BamA